MASVVLYFVLLLLWPRPAHLEMAGLLHYTVVLCCCSCLLLLEVFDMEVFTVSRRGKGSNMLDAYGERIVPYWESNHKPVNRYSLVTFPPAPFLLALPAPSAFVKDKQFSLCDFGSAGGTFVRLASGVPTPLYPSMMIMLGKHQVCWSVSIQHSSSM